MQECGECTLCCKLLELHEIPSKIGEWCKYCDKTKGCSIYVGKPKECDTYKCMWLEMENVGVELRPDKSHIIFNKASDKTICAMQDPDYKLDSLVMQQIKEFNKQGYSVVIRKNEMYYTYLTKGHTLKEAKRDIDGRSKLHRRLN